MQSGPVAVKAERSLLHCKHTTLSNYATILIAGYKTMLKAEQADFLFVCDILQEKIDTDTWHDALAACANLGFISDIIIIIIVVVI